MGQEPASTFFSHIKPGHTPYKAGGLRDFFLYRDLGIAGAICGRALYDGRVDARAALRLLEAA